MEKGLTNLIHHSVGGISHNRYALNIDGLVVSVSALQVDGNEQLNQQWFYTIIFTSPNKHLPVESFS